MKQAFAPCFLALGTIVCLAQTQPSKPLAPDALLVAPKATDVKYEAFENPCKLEARALGSIAPRYCGDRVTYFVHEPYPAVNLLAFIRNTLKERHWRLLHYDYPNGNSFSDDRTWLTYQDARQGSAHMVYQWWAIWENDKHDVVSYVLEYRNPAPDLETSKKKEHLMHSARVGAEYVPGKVAYHACEHASIVHELKGSESWSHPLGSGLDSRLDAGGASGWTISVSPKAKPDQDWTYPVNLPLRGQRQEYPVCCGESVKQDLQTRTEHGLWAIRFATTKSDYARFSKLVDRMLQESGTAAHSAFQDEKIKTPTGMLTISALEYDASDDGTELYSAKLKFDIVVPKTFSLDPSLKWTLTRCPGPFQ